MFPALLQKRKNVLRLRPTPITTTGRRAQTSARRHAPSHNERIVRTAAQSPKPPHASSRPGTPNMTKAKFGAIGVASSAMRSIGNPSATQMGHSGTDFLRDESGGAGMKSPRSGAFVGIDLPERFAVQSSLLSYRWMSWKSASSINDFVSRPAQPTVYAPDEPVSIRPQSVLPTQTTPQSNWK